MDFVRGAAEAGDNVGNLLERQLAVESKLSEGEWHDFHSDRRRPLSFLQDLAKQMPSFTVIGWCRATTERTRALR